MASQPAPQDDFDLSDDLPELLAEGEGNKPWTLAAAVALASAVEAVAPRFGCHVGLTGGTLYKPGARKDVDLLFYRIRQAPEIDRAGLLEALEGIGLYMTTRHGWVQKALYQGMPVDLFFPDHVDGINEATGEYC